MQLYFVTIHQPSWMYLRRSAGLYMYSGGRVGSVLPSSMVTSASTSSCDCRFGLGMRSASIGFAWYFPWS